MTYDDLDEYARSNIYGEARDLDQDIPRLITRAQRYLFSRLDHDVFQADMGNFQVNQDGRIDTGNVSDRLKEVRSVDLLRDGQWFPLLKRDVTTLGALFSEDPVGLPEYYAQTDDLALKVFPFPYDQMTVRMRGNLVPELITPSNQTNMLSEKYPLLMEWAITYQCSVYMLDPTLIQVNKGELDGEIMAVNAQVSRWRRDEATQRPVETRNVGGS